MTAKRSELSDEQRRALEHQQGKLLYVVDANTQETYVLLPAAAFRRAQALFDDDFAALDMYAAMSQARFLQLKVILARKSFVFGNWDGVGAIFWCHTS